MEPLCQLLPFIILIFGKLLNQKMSTIDVRTFADKVTKGFNLAAKRLIESIKKEDGELVISKNGEIIKIKARELK
jgi:hypothetical protein